MSDPVIVIVDDDDSVFIEEIDDEIEVYEVAYIGGGAEIDAAVAAAVAAQAAAEAAAEDIAAASAQIDANTAAITVNSDAITAANTTIAFEQAAVAVRRGPSVGITLDSTPMRDAYLDAAGRAITIFTPDRTRYDVERHGLLRQAIQQLEIKGPSLGWLTTVEAGPAKRAGVDTSGRLTDAEAQGWGHQGARHTATPKGMATELIDRTPETATVTGTTVAIPAARIDLAAGPLDTVTTLLSMPAPASEAVTAEAFTMTYATNIVLAYQYIRGSIVVTKTAGSVVLTEGTDYSLDRDRGWVLGLVNTANFACTIAYTGYKQRADLIVADASSGTVSRIAGTERKRAPAMEEAALTGTARPLYRALRWVDGCDLVPLHRFSGNQRIGAEGRYLARLERNRNRLRRFIAKLDRGQDVRLGLYGDSISAMGSLDFSMNTSPNTLYRDRVAFFQDYDTATRALIPTYDYGDGAGQIHIREGAGWKTAQFIQNKYGVEVDYRNWGVGGTTTQATSAVNSGVTIYNGSHPTRLQAICDDHCDLVICAFGANELGYGLTASNYATIIAALQANGADVLLLTPTRRSVLPTTQYLLSYDEWRFTCNEIDRAADLAGVACVSSWYAFGRENLGAAGLAEREICDQSLLNHPGLKELNAWASLVTDLF